MIRETWIEYSKMNLLLDKVEDAKPGTLTACREGSKCTSVCIGIYLMTHYELGAKPDLKSRLDAAICMKDEDCKSL